MGLGSWVSGAWGKVKGAASKAFDVGKKVVGKVAEGVKYVGKAAKPIVNVAQKVAGFVENIPGAIGDVGKLARGGLEKVNKWIDLIPSGSIKDKLKEASSGAGELIGRGEDLAQRGAQRVGGWAEQAKPWIGTADRLAQVASGITRKTVDDLYPKTEQEKAERLRGQQLRQGASRYYRDIKRFE